MSDVSTKLPAARTEANTPLSHLQQEYDAWQGLLDAQPKISGLS